MAAIDMSKWPKSRDERLCPHGVGHPEPCKKHHGGGVHGCDGCCTTDGLAWAKQQREKPVSEPIRKVTVQREATLKSGEFAVQVVNGNTYLREAPDHLLMMVHASSIAIPAGEEQKIIQLLQWVMEERARWSVLEQNDRVGM